MKLTTNQVSEYLAIKTEELKKLINAKRDLILENPFLGYNYLWIPGQGKFDLKAQAEYLEQYYLSLDTFRSFNHPDYGEVPLLRDGLNDDHRQHHIDFFYEAVKHFEQLELDKFEEKSASPPEPGSIEDVKQNLGFETNSLDAKDVIDQVKKTDILNTEKVDQTYDRKKIIDEAVKRIIESSDLRLTAMLTSVLDGQTPEKAFVIFNAIMDHIDRNKKDQFNYEDLQELSKFYKFKIPDLPTKTPLELAKQQSDFILKRIRNKFKLIENFRTIKNSKSSPAADQLLCLESIAKYQDEIDELFMELRSSIKQEAVLNETDIPAS